MVIDSGKPVRVRFAPSPTGMVHLGTMRAALYNYLFAKKYKGTMVLRIEDTDQTRLVSGAVENIVRTFAALGIVPDEGPRIESDGSVREHGSHGPYVQSARLALYTEYAHRLVQLGAAYYCVCSSERLESMRATQMAAKQPTRYDRKCRDTNMTKEDAAKNPQSVIRLKVPDNKVVTFYDLVHGEVSFSTKEIDDQVMLKSDGFPTYHLAVVVDDHLMEISHVIRGDDWMPSTPKQVLTYQAFGWAVPAFAHLPLLLNADRTKLSKRKADVSVESYLQKGILPDALFNFIALLGWNPTADREIYTREELINLFDLTKVNMSGAVVNFEKLDWLNGNYIREKKPEELLSLTVPYLVKAGLVMEHDEIIDGKTTARLYRVDDNAAIKKPLTTQWLMKVISVERERMKRLGDIAEATEFFFRTPQYEVTSLVWKNTPAEKVGETLEFLVQLVQGLPEAKWSAPDLETSIKTALAEKGFKPGEVLWPMRVALSGREASPPPFDIAAILGKDETVKRIKNALTRIQTP